MFANIYNTLGEKTCIDAKIWVFLRQSVQIIYAPVCWFDKIKARIQFQRPETNFSPLQTWNLVSILHLNAPFKAEHQSIFADMVAVGQKASGQCSQGHSGVTITAPHPPTLAERVY